MHRHIFEPPPTKTVGAQKSEERGGSIRSNNLVITITVNLEENARKHVNELHVHVRFFLVWLGSKYVTLAVHINCYSREAF